ncbi:MAG: HlyC/CorC family transporter [Peptostreptococcaceae bacterium]|nr:HlyC/CorC family transporter [Peptostreptococcaceae bacterium]
MNYVIVIMLLLLSAIFSGLTIGLFSLNVSELKRKIRLGDKKAQKVYRVRKNGNLLLCTLLTGNVAVNSTMAIFLGSIATGVVAGLVSTGLILIFGEILPQAVFSRNALKIGAKTAWLVQGMIYIFSPVCYPLSIMLDLMLGKELPTIWSKSELGEIIKEHEDSPDSNIDEDEERIILGALSFSEKKAIDVMTPRTVSYLLEAGRIIDDDLLEEIISKGFSRIPVYEGTDENIIGILYVKKLVGFCKGKGFTVGDVCEKRGVIFTDRDTRLDNLLNVFIHSRSHMALVYGEYGMFNGIVTLEDIVEEILKVEIVDEQDRTEDMQKLALSKHKAKMEQENMKSETK